MSTACLLLLLVIASVDAKRVIRAAPESNKTGYYIVKLEDDISHDRFEELEKEILSESSDHHIHEKFDGNISKIITARLTEDARERIKHMNNVELLEEETYATGSQINAPWHLDMLDQKSGTLDERYDPIGDGEGVDIYILDSGVYYEHEEFEGRAEYPGFDPIDNSTGSNERGRDCNGHGTHVASLAAGSFYGAAKKAKIYSVRVLGCDNAAPWSTVILGMELAVQRASETGRPSIISMSLGGRYSYSVDVATRRVTNGDTSRGVRGIPVVAAAGNDRSNACFSSPASTSTAITVGGLASGTTLYTFTNYGPCVDIFAPGVDVYAASHSCSNCYRYSTGTSMAAPLVSGVMAIMLGRQPLLTSAELQQLIIDNSRKNALTFGQEAAGTPNRLLHIAGDCGGIFNIQKSAATLIHTPYYPDNYLSELVCTYKLTAPRGQIVQAIVVDCQTMAGDFMEVIDGYYVEYLYSLGHLEGSFTTSKTYQSTVNAMTLQFVTNCDGLVARGCYIFAQAADDPNPSDAITVTETVDVITTNTVTESQTLTNTLTETTSVRVTVPTTITESRTLTDTLTETDTVTQTTSVNVTVPTTITESQTLTDTIVLTQTTRISIHSTSTVTQTETISTVHTHLESCSMSTTQVNVSPTPEGVCCEMMSNFNKLEGNLLNSVEDIMTNGIHSIANLMRSGNITIPDREIAPTTTIISTNTMPTSTISTSTTSTSIMTTATLVVTQTPESNRNGLHEDSPASSCSELLGYAGYSSGHYYIASASGTGVLMYCELDKDIRGNRGLVRVADLDMTNATQDCPGELQLLSQPNRTCQRGTTQAGCSSAIFETHNVPYTKVLGRIRAYQYSSPNAFFHASFLEQNAKLTDTYVDGVVLINKNSTNHNQHIWTFAAGLDATSRRRYEGMACPCLFPNSPDISVPSYVGDDFFCETAVPGDDFISHGKFYSGDPLWDGAGCKLGDDCCKRGQYFVKTFNEATTSDIELRLCGDEDRLNEDTPIELIELYVQ